MVERYEYSPIPDIPDDSYFIRIVSRDVGVRCIGMTKQHFKDTLIIYFERALTSAEKSILDGLVASPPAPVAMYEFSPLTPEDVEAEIGIKPVILAIDPATGTATCHFDTTLTATQEAALEALLRVPMRFKRRKP